MTEETNNIEITKARSRVTTNTPALAEIYLPSFFAVWLISGA
jgi:hypothetical protein